MKTDRIRAVRTDERPVGWVDVGGVGEEVGSTNRCIHYICSIMLRIILYNCMCVHYVYTCMYVYIYIYVYVYIYIYI